MKVIVVRQGGFAGIERRGESSSASDPLLHGLVSRVDFAALPPPGRIPDQFTYEISVDGSTYLVGETQVTGPLRELVHHVLGRPG